MATETQTKRPTPKTNGEGEPPPQEGEAVQTTIEEVVEPLAKATIKEYRMDYAVKLTANYQTVEYQEGITVEIEGEDKEARSNKYYQLREALMQRVYKTARTGRKEHISDAGRTG